MSKIEKAELSLNELDVVEAQTARELSDAELETVAGGMSKGGDGSGNGPGRGRGDGRGRGRRHRGGWYGRR